MNTTLAQLQGMVRYEFKMHWRRRALKVIMLALLVLIGVVALVQHTPDFETEVYEPIKGETGLADAELRTWFIIFTTWFVSVTTLGFILPIAVADTIPLDKQTRVAELFNSLPLARGTYLAGKVMGVWAATLFGAFVLMVVTGVGWWLFLGRYNPLPYVGMWLLGLGSIIILNGGLGVLVPATQPSRLRAVLISLVLIFIVPNFLGMDGNFNNDLSLWDFMNPLRWPIFNYYVRVNQAGALNDAILAVVVGLAELVVIGAAIWGWQRWKVTKA